MPTATPALPDATDADFADLVRRHPNLVVDAWAPWCKPCLRLEPILHQLAQEYAGRVTIARLDADENPRTAQQLQVMSMPTLVFYRDGRRVGHVVGLQSPDALRKRFDEAFGFGR